jgi:DNA-binding transcriptional MerR regulator
MSSNGLLKMSELAEASGVSAATIKHYLREGLLPEPVRTSRNMAYYPPEFVERIRLIKQLQEERFMPLRAIRQVLDDDPDRVRALIDLEDRIIEGAKAREAAGRMSVAEASRRYDVPREVLDRLAELGVLSPGSRGYTASDVKIVEAISRFRAGGYDERLGFTVYDTLRYKDALERLVSEEVDVLMERLGDMDPARAAQLIADGAEPLNDLMSALHSKLLVAELERQRAARG